MPVSTSLPPNNVAGRKVYTILCFEELVCLRFKKRGRLEWSEKGLVTGERVKNSVWRRV